MALFAGNSAMHFSILMMGSSYVISTCRDSLMNFFGVLSDYMEAQFFIKTEVKCPTVTSYVMHYLNKDNNTNYEVKFDSYSSNSKYNIKSKPYLSRFNLYKYKNMFIRIYPISDDKIDIKFLNNETITEEIVKEFLDKCRESYETYIRLGLKNKISLYKLGDRKWNQIGESPQKPLNSICGYSVKKIIADVAKFHKNEKYYVKHNIKYKRAFVLHGPPGTGKTTIVNVLATLFGMSIYSISLKDSNLDDKFLLAACNAVGSKSIILLEDFDFLSINTDSRGKNPTEDNNSEINKSDYKFSNIDSNGNSKINLSTLLQILDGNDASAGVIFIITTNHYKECRVRLGDEFFRPGRIDVIHKFDYSSIEDIREYYKIFYNNEIEDNISESKYLIKEEVNAVLDFIKDKTIDDLLLTYNTIKITDKNKFYFDNNNNCELNNFLNEQSMYGKFDSEHKNNISENINKILKSYLFKIDDYSYDLFLVNTLLYLYYLENKVDNDSSTKLFVESIKEKLNIANHTLKILSTFKDIYYTCIIDNHICMEILNIFSYRFAYLIKSNNNNISMAELQKYMLIFINNHIGPLLYFDHLKKCDNIIIKHVEISDIAKKNAMKDDNTNNIIMSCNKENEISTSTFDFTYAFIIFALSKFYFIIYNCIVSNLPNTSGSEYFTDKKITKTEKYKNITKTEKYIKNVKSTYSINEEDESISIINK